MESAPSISVHHLKKTYSRTVRDPGLKSAFRALFTHNTVKVEAVRDVSFEVRPGELVGFLGPNGAGKTTTLKMLSGILFPTGGTATVLGYAPWERRNEFRRNIGLVMGQRNQLWWDLPVSESFRLSKILYEIPDDVYTKRLQMFTELLEVQDIVDTPARKLSLGQRMRCELIAAMIHEPQILFLDEPTIGLDVVSQKRIRDFLKQYVSEKQMTVLLTSHNMEDIEDLCRRVIVIHEGNILYDGELMRLRRQYATHKSVTVQLAETTKVDALSELGQVESQQENEFRISVPRENVQEVAKTILSKYDVADISIEEPRVETIIRKMFENESHSVDNSH